MIHDYRLSFKVKVGKLLAKANKSIALIQKPQAHWALLTITIVYKTFVSPHLCFFSLFMSLICFYTP